MLQAECVRAVKGLALPRTSHSGEIALAGSRRLHNMLVAALVFFAHALVTEAENRTSAAHTAHAPPLPHTHQYQQHLQSSFHLGRLSQLLLLWMLQPLCHATQTHSHPGHTRVQ